MGPTASGKTTIGRALAAQLGWRFLDGDSYHPPGNIERMRRGETLSDADREPWLAALHDEIVRALERREHTIVASSALKERYRIRLAGGLRHVRFVFLHAPAHVLRSRAAARTDHFAGPELVAAQLADLEEPREAFLVDATRPPETIVSAIRVAFGV